MILNLGDAAEVVFLTLILRAAASDRPISEVLNELMKPNKRPGLLQKIQGFARIKLEHPVMKLALAEMEELLAASRERGVEDAKESDRSLG